VIGIRPGEKLHEVMISEDDARNTLEFDDHYVIQPEFGWWKRHKNTLEVSGAKQVTDNFRYSSDNNDKWLSLDELKAIVAPFENEQ
jgi:UDP-N-acetylglucosamine 4,6-dehydratase